MSVFRPVTRVTDRDGRDWEIYAYRIQLPPREDGQRKGRIRRGLRLVVSDLPRAALAARRSDEWTIDAVTRVPQRTTYTWRTTAEYRGHVLAQVEAGIADGEIPRPRHATFVGSWR